MDIGSLQILANPCKFASQLCKKKNLKNASPFFGVKWVYHKIYIFQFQTFDTNWPSLMYIPFWPLSNQHFLMECFIRVQFNIYCTVLLTLIHLTGVHKRLTLFHKHITLKNKCEKVLYKFVIVAIVKTRENPWKNRSSQYGGWTRTNYISQ